MSEKTATKRKNVFDKHSIINSRKYKVHAPELSVLLKDGTHYTLDDVNKILQDFLKRKDDGK